MIKTIFLIKCGFPLFFYVLVPKINVLNVGHIAHTANFLPFSVTDTTTMLHVSLADTATTLEISITNAQTTLQDSIADTQAMLQFSIAFLTTKTANSISGA